MWLNKSSIPTGRPGTERLKELNEKELNNLGKFQWVYKELGLPEEIGLWYTNEINGRTTSDWFYETDFLKDKEKWESMADKIYYSGCIDEYYDYCYGPLEYRSVRFETVEYDKENYQGNAVINYTSDEVPYTRIIEHKWFNNKGSDKTIVSREYSSEWKKGEVPYYPVNNEKNNTLYQKYKNIENKKVCFVGRLGEYKYYDMDDTVEKALNYII